MSWAISFFFALLLVALILLAITTLMVNDFERKADAFTEALLKRYDLQKLRNAYLQQLEEREE